MSGPEVSIAEIGGVARESPAGQRHSNKLISASAAMGALLGALLALAGEHAGPWFGARFALVYAGMLIFYWSWSGRFLAHYPALAALLAVWSLALLLLAGRARGGVSSAVVGFGLGLAGVGIATAAAGLLDHRWLARRMRPPVDEDAPDPQPGEVGGAGTL